MTNFCIPIYDVYVYIYNIHEKIITKKKLSFGYDWTNKNSFTMRFMCFLI